MVRSAGPSVAHLGGSRPALSALLPPTASVVEAFDDALPAPLHPSEAVMVERAVASRRQEFATGRRCAREALAGLGLAPGPVPSGPNREPVWPTGVVGSITHCVGFRAAAVARATQVASLGVDAEPHQPLPRGVLTAVSTAAERDRLAELAALEPETRWDRLLFSAKESVYKAWYPLARRWLGFEDAELVFDPARGRFDATVTVVGPGDGEGPGRVLAGRYRVVGSLLLTAVTVTGAGEEPSRAGGEGS